MTFRSVSSSSSRRPGLTLLELIVVLVILVALAGMLVPLLPSMVERIHTATGATNITEIYKTLQVHEQVNQRYPTDFDALVDANGVLADYIPGVSLATPQITTLTLSAAQRDALVNAGITMLAPMHKDRAGLGTTGTPTFNPYSGASFSMLTGTPKVAQVSELVVESTVVRDPELNTTGDVYVIVGIGSRCSMIGKSIADAPVHFGDGPTNSAASVYGRYCAIFRVTRGGTTPQPLSRAALVGVVALHAEGIITSNAHIEENLELQRSQ